MPTALHEYTTVDKSTWKPGAWKNEPDKIQWIDEATGLDCLVVRGPSGALCGYVGVPEGHPYFGVEYSGCTSEPKCDESWCGHRPESAINVHGGLTFSDFCHEPTREGWEKWRTGLRARAAEAEQYPRGDTAERFRTMGHLLDDFEAWKAYGVSAFICHLPVAGRTDRVWWLGFDCAHSGDVCPKYSADDRWPMSGYEWYKDRSYVERQVALLAEQLKCIGEGKPLPVRDE